MIHIKRREQLDFGYELFIAAVSIAYLPGVDQDAINVVYIINAVLTLLFIYDFGLRLATAPSRSSYFFRDFGWADLLACIPALRIFRMFRIYKAYRIVRKYGMSYIKSYLSSNRAASALYILVVMVILIIEAGGFLVLQAERASESANILTAGDAIWWAYVTITTPVSGYYRWETGRYHGNDYRGSSLCDICRVDIKQTVSLSCKGG